MLKPACEQDKKENNKLTDANPLIVARIRRSEAQNSSSEGQHQSQLPIDDQKPLTPIKRMGKAAQITGQR